MNRLMIKAAVAQESDGPIGSLLARSAEKLGEALARGPPGPDGGAGEAVARY